MIDGLTIPVVCHGLGSLYVSAADDDDDEKDDDNDDDADERTRDKGPGTRGAIALHPRSTLLLRRLSEYRQTSADSAAMKRRDETS